MSTIPTDANADQGKTAAQLWAEEAAANPAAQNPAVAPAEPNPASASAPVAQDPVAPPDASQTATPAPGTPAAGTQPTDDPYAGMHPAIRARLQNTDSLESRLRKVEGHAGNLNRTVKQQADLISALNEQLQAARQTTAATGNAAPTKLDVQQASKSSEKWNQLKQEFPEWADAVEERLSAAAPAVDVEALRTQVTREVVEGLKSGTLKVDGLQTQPAQQTPGEQPAVSNEQTVDETIERRVVDAAHPGWLDLVKTKQFTDWMGTQPPEIRRLGESPIAEDAVALLSSYKDFAAKQPNADDLRQKRQQQLQDAATVTRGKSSLEAQKSVDDMSPEEIWAYEARKLEESKRSQRR